jgi:hypothetical protein
LKGVRYHHRIFTQVRQHDDATDFLVQRRKGEPEGVLTTFKLGSALAGERQWTKRLPLLGLVGPLRGRSVAQPQPQDANCQTRGPEKCS